MMNTITKTISWLGKKFFYSVFLLCVTHTNRVAAAQLSGLNQEEEKYIVTRPKLQRQEEDENDEEEVQKYYDGLIEGKTYGDKDEQGNYDHRYTVLLLGSTGGGKTTLLKQMAEEMFDEKITSTLQPRGIFYGLRLSGRKVCFHLWDTPGEGVDLTRRLARLVFRDRNVHCIVLCYDTTNLESLEVCEKEWLQEIKDNCKSVPSLVVCGTKSDFKAQRQVYNAHVTRFGNACRNSNLFRDVDFIETSAKMGKNIKELICMIALASLDYEPLQYGKLTLKVGDLVYVSIDGNKLKARILSAHHGSLEVLIVLSNSQAEYKRAIEPKQLISLCEAVDYTNKENYLQVLAARQDGASSSSGCLVQ